MYSNQSFDEKVTGSNRNENYDLCNTETGQKFVIKWSPQDCARYLSKGRYASPRSVSKSVPRRKRGIVRYNINRSLNFDVGSRKSDNFKSPNSSSDSNVSIDGDQYLSRSSKILRALNINYSPLQSVELGTRRINKSLNFDLSPSPKRLTNFGKSSRNKSLKTYPSPLSKINKTLDFDTSSSDSNINSVLSSSVESIDENQNQTPSQRNKSAKKSLIYLTPSSEKGCGSPDSNAQSPMLRSGLKTKIDNIVSNNLTPNMESTKRIQKIKCNDFEASTPRNLFNDFDDDDDDDNNDENDDRPYTPENVIRIIPESMSAIKKSHKKERVLGRIGKAVAYLAESRSHAFTDKAIDVPLDESRSTTPILTVHQYQSPQCVLSSIKKSHKKDKSKRKSLAYHSDDNMSDTGSLFDYTEESNAIQDSSIPSSIAKSNENLVFPEIKVSNADEAEFEGDKNSHVNDKALSETGSSLIEKDDHEKDIEDNLVDQSCFFNNSETSKVADRSPLQLESNKQDDDSPSFELIDNGPNTPPRNPTNGNSLRPSTPENRINFLQRIMTNSIKKSHKKIKDINRKSLFRGRIVHDDNTEDTEHQEHQKIEEPVNTENEERAGTPENTNSSRLLLSQFSSIKKSHRKDKHRRMLTGSIQRMKLMNGDCDVASNSDDEPHNSSLSSSVSDLPNILPPKISPKGRKGESNDFSSDNSNDSNYRAFDKSLLKDAALEMGIGALSSSNFLKSSPNKRKNLLDVSSTSGFSQSSSNPESIYESAEEEFKIFTPIKKRKSLGIVAPTARRICETNYQSPDKGKSMDDTSMENSASRCSTPTTARSNCLIKPIESNFKTPDRNSSGVFVTISDYSTTVPRDIDNVDDPSGRSTPQNSSTAVLMAGINSIKKSHKKDKRSNISRRSLISAQEEEYESEVMSNIVKDQSKSSFDTKNSPQPSTSYESAVELSITEPENETVVQTKTPPNCLKVKTYLRLVQTASIKRSHKKVRERKKFRTIVVDPELSDDGSLFDETEKSLAMENESIKNLQKGNETDFLPTVKSKMNVQNSPQEECRYYVQDGASNYNDNLSNDGSIFGSEERLDLLYENNGTSGDQEPNV